MKPVKLFYLKNCPFCKKALRYIEEASSGCSDSSIISTPSWLPSGSR